MFFIDVRLAGQSNADIRQASQGPQNFGVYWANLPDLFAGCFLLMFQRRWESPCAAAVTAFSLRMLAILPGVPVGYKHAHPESAETRSRLTATEIRTGSSSDSDKSAAVAKQNLSISVVIP